MAGENDIVARFITVDETSKNVKEIAKNVKDATDKIRDDAGKTKSVFDKWNFSLNLLKAGFKAFNFVAKQNADLQADWNEVLKFTAFTLENVTTEILRLTGIAPSLSAAMDGIAGANLSEELRRSNAALLGFNRSADLTEEQLKKIEATLGGVTLEGFADFIKDAKAASKVAEEERNRVLNATQELSIMTGIDPRKAKKIIDEITAKQKQSIDDIKKTREEDEKEQIESIQRVAAAFEEVNKDEAERVAKIWNDTFVGGFSNAAKSLEDEFLNLGRIGERFAKETHATISDNLFRALKGEAVSFRDFMASILNSILRQATDATAAALLGSFGGSAPQSSGFAGLLGGLFGGNGGNDPTVNAHGNIYDNGLKKFARGGVVNAPTTFGFNGGRGLMGEAGPEAIIPLERTASGDLGVQATGLAPSVTINVSAIDAAGVAAFLARGDVKRALLAQVESGFGTSPSLRRAAN